MNIKISELLRHKPVSKVKFVSKIENKDFMKEYAHFDGDDYVTFNLIEVDLENMIVHLVETKNGCIKHTDYDLFNDGALYFMYGLYCNKIYIKDFRKIA